jgi:hypothetical protein
MWIVEKKLILNRKYDEFISGLNGYRDKFYLELVLNINELPNNICYLKFINSI